MSRVGKYPVAIPDGVTVEVKNQAVLVKGKKGELRQPFTRDVNVEVKDKEVLVTPRNKAEKRSRAMWGLTRSLVNNMVEGVSSGFSKVLEAKGVGYRVGVQGSLLSLSLGYSHEIKYAIPDGIEIVADSKNNILTINGFDKRLVGQVAAEIRSLRKPEPYKGKGVRYKDEYVRMKEGKKK